MFFVKSNTCMSILLVCSAGRLSLFLLHSPFEQKVDKHSSLLFQKSQLFIIGVKYLLKKGHLTQICIRQYFDFQKEDMSLILETFFPIATNAASK